MNLSMVLATFGMLILHISAGVSQNLAATGSRKAFSFLLTIQPTLWRHSQHTCLLSTFNPNYEIMTSLESSNAMFPVIVDCCTEVAHNIPRRRLRTVEKFKIQKGEVCKIPAVILYTKHKKLCVSLQNKHVKRWIKQKDNGHRRTSRHFRKRKKAQRGRKIGRKQ
ncbi:C-C motif chemokine 28 [Eublepharis macularius]|uniref:C-C motif chemokine n=1 Tax=Eublepharis macularius TaxID=481883 RepID=A0AA97L626_EUBMA|nr:C-C motif chemokine 28 [Eublepharis macularius]